MSKYGTTGGGTELETQNRDDSGVALPGSMTRNDSDNTDDINDDLMIMNNNKFNRPNITTLLNERKSRQILFNSIILSWVLPQLVRISEQLIEKECETNYCKAWIAGYSLTTFACIISYFVIYLDNANEYLKWFVSIILWLGVIVIMSASFGSLEDLCQETEDGTFEQNNICNIGVIAPTLLGSLLSVLFGFDYIFDEYTLNTPKKRIICFCSIVTLCFIMTTIFVFDFDNQGKFVNVNETFQDLFLAEKLGYIIYVILNGIFVIFGVCEFKLFGGINKSTNNVGTMIIGLIYWVSLILTNSTFPTFYDESRTQFIVFTISGIIAVEMNLLSKLYE